MEVRCAVCGAVASLDMIIVNDEAREVVAALYKISNGLGKVMIQYVALFRPAQRQLSMPRMAKLLNQLVPDIRAQRITHNRVEYDAPVECWIWAAEQTLAARDGGRLQLPLDGHGFLYKVMTSWPGSRQQQPVGVMTPVPARPLVSKTAQAAGGLLARAQDARNRDD